MDGASNIVSNSIGSECVSTDATNPKTDEKTHMATGEMRVEGRQQQSMFDTVLFENGQVEQKLWPIHCVDDSWGVQLHPRLIVAHDAIRVHKGTLAHVDAYSAFWDNMCLNETGLRQELQSRKVTDVFLCGLDYCVATSAIDASKLGSTSFVILDGCRGLSEAELEQRKRDMKGHGVLLINSVDIDTYLVGPRAATAAGISLLIKQLQMSLSKLS